MVESLSSSDFPSMLPSIDSVSDELEGVRNGTQQLLERLFVLVNRASEGDVVSQRILKLLADNSRSLLSTFLDEDFAVVSDDGSFVVLAKVGAVSDLLPEDFGDMFDSDVNGLDGAED